MKQTHFGLCVGGALWVGLLAGGVNYFESWAPVPFLAVVLGAAAIGVWLGHTLRGCLPWLPSFLAGATFFGFMAGMYYCRAWSPTATFIEVLIYTSALGSWLLHKRNWSS